MVLSLPVEAQLTVVNSMILPLLKRSGIGVVVSATRSGMNLALEFKEPAAATDGADDPGKVFGTDSSDKAAALWELKARVEEARAVHLAHHDTVLGA